MHIKLESKKSRAQKKGLKVFYVRLSADKRKKDGQEQMNEEVEYANQLAELRRLWPGEPDQIVCEKKSGRNPFKLLMELIEELPEESVIYGVTIDRLTRMGPFALGSIVELAKARNIKLHVTEEGDLTHKEFSAAQQMMAAMKAYGASLEAEAIGRRMKMMIEDRRKKGLPWGFEIARQSPNWRHGSRPRKELWAKAMPRLLELKAQGKTMREISAIASREYGDVISASTICRLFKEAREKKKETV